MDKAEIAEKLRQGGSLTTKDFEILGYSFEAFLRYAQLSEAGQKKAHDFLISKFGEGN